MNEGMKRTCSQYVGVVDILRSKSASITGWSATDNGGANRWESMATTSITSFDGPYTNSA
jgi:hypothetical protein